ncbi:MAG: hypothetical protein EZS28_014265 [Streblomastix strix]|uniref:Uncharacterized protein n=1 Tax=Streblomastix strix TaxID=222440 RepID=A0A5J4W6C3_9EUKA|nr:MAG: hypothetical protein EZS28_014265 [Streblomastix strix]
MNLKVNVLSSQIQQEMRIKKVEEVEVLVNRVRMIALFVVITVVTAVIQIMEISAQEEIILNVLGVSCSSALLIDDKNEVQGGDDQGKEDID